MSTNITNTESSQYRRAVAISVTCDRASRKCMITVVTENSGYADIEDATPREIVQRIKQLQDDPSLIVRAIDPADIHAIVRPLAIKAGVTATPFEMAADDDAAWFRRNPRSRHRTRALFHDELGGFGNGTRVLVTQIAPGLRVRQFGYVGEAVQ
jgi:hypothetical protein